MPNKNFSYALKFQNAALHRKSMGAAYTTNIVNGASAKPWGDGSNGWVYTDGYQEMHLLVKSDKALTIEVSHGDDESAFHFTDVYQIGAACNKPIRVPLWAEKVKVEYKNGSGADTTAIRLKGYLLTRSAGPREIPDNAHVQGTATVDNTSNVALVAAAGAGKRTYLDTLLATNTHATNAATLIFKDGNTEIFRAVIPASTTLNLSPRRFLRGSPNTAWNIALGGAHTDVRVGYTGYQIPD